MPFKERVKKVGRLGAMPYCTLCRVLCVGILCRVLCVGILALGTLCRVLCVTEITVRDPHSYTTTVC